MAEKILKKWGLAVYWLFATLYWEVLVHGAMYGHFQGNIWYALGFAAALGAAVSALVGLLPGRAVFPVNVALTAAMTLIYGSQMVYCFIFGTPYSVSQMGMGAGAITSFWRELLSTMRGNLLWILGLLVPFVVLFVLRKLGAMQRASWKRQGALALLAVALGAATYGSILGGGKEMFSDYYFFTSTTSTTNQTMERFGVPMTFCLELTHTNASQEDIGMGAFVDPMPAPTETAETEATEEEQPEVQPMVYNVLDVDFEALSQSTEDPKLKALNDFIAQRPATNQNAYTGMLKDYNLIVLCAESFSPAAVDPELTPTLYKLTHEGFLFRNYYNSFPNTTINGEYALTQGLYPESERGTYDSSMILSRKNALPFVLGNAFAQQRGIAAKGFHNYAGYYYGRNLSHPNMGYTMKFAESGMNFSTSWPSSDLEMMEQSVDDYIHEPQFHAYYMTFSGHIEYKVPENGIARKNYSLVNDLPLTMAQKAYLACNIELDRAMEYLLQRLEEEGIADKTAIVMASDHIPYGLREAEYFELLGESADPFLKFKSDLVFWVGGMEEPVEVDAYCCNVDVLPTILNLWGFDYDSRMLPGTDILSDGLHAAVLFDRSFLTDQVWFNSNTRETRFQVPEEDVPEDYVEKMNRYIASCFEMSSNILKTDYFRFALGDETPAE